MHIAIEGLLFGLLASWPVPLFIYGMWSEWKGRTRDWQWRMIVLWQLGFLWSIIPGICFTAFFQHGGLKIIKQLIVG